MPHTAPRRDSRSTLREPLYSVGSPSSEPGNGGSIETRCWTEDSMWVRRGRTRTDVMDLCKCLFIARRSVVNTQTSAILQVHTRPSMLLYFCGLVCRRRKDHSSLCTVVRGSRSGRVTRLRLMSRVVSCHCWMKVQSARSLLLVMGLWVRHWTVHYRAEPRQRPASPSVASTTWW